MASQYPLAKNQQQSRRRIKYEWVRDSEGEVLPIPAPIGIRTPSNLPWAHHIGEVFWIRRIPGTNSMTPWTRSMIKEYGESPGYWAADDLQVSPRLVRPWPLLRVPRELDPEQIYCIVDEGCGFDHEFQDCPTRVDEAVVRATIVDTKSAEETPVVEECSRVDQPQHQEGAVSSVPLDNGHNMDGSSADQNVQPNQVASPGESAIETLVVADSSIAVDPVAAVEPAKSTFTPTVEVKPVWPDNNPQSPITPFDRLTPKLEEFIPVAFFPDVILVQDPSRVCSGKEAKARRARRFEVTEGLMGVPTRYIRMFPPPEKAGAAIPILANEDEKRAPQVAHLNLTAAPLLGVGHHSSVVRGGLRLPKPITADSPSGEVSVACKFAFGGSEERRLLATEALIYNQFPKHLQQQYCGFNLAYPNHDPVPAAACVPKFFGYYVPADDRLSPMLLLEECGAPVTPATFTADQRSECYSSIIRLHHADFMQGSCYIRNILTQPGPISKPPSQRSADTPSFRIIDFGRARSMDLEKEHHAPLSMLGPPSKSPGSELKNASGPMDVEGEEKDEGEAEAKNKKADAEGEEKVAQSRKQKRDRALLGIQNNWWAQKQRELRQGESELKAGFFEGWAF